MATDYGPEDVGCKPDSAGSGHWSVAALAVGCALLVMVPIALLFTMYYGVNTDSYMNGETRVLALASSIMALMIILGLAVMNVVAATFGLRESRLTGRGGGLALMALLASIAAMALWIDVSIHLMFTMIDAL